MFLHDLCNLWSITNQNFKKMTQFTLNIPTEKVQKFLNMMVQTGFSKAINNAKTNNTNVKKLIPVAAVNSANNKHPCFDWEFYTNDLLID